MTKLENLTKRIEIELKGTEKDYQEATITEYKEYLFGKIFVYEHILSLIARTELNIITQEHNYK
jgi:hypothetical protein